MKRILLIVLAIVIAVSCFAVPALAAPVGPADVDAFSVADYSSSRIVEDGIFWYKLDMNRFERIIRTGYNNVYPAAEYVTNSVLTLKNQSVSDTDTFNFRTICFGYAEDSVFQYLVCDDSYLNSDTIYFRVANDLFDTSGHETPDVELAVGWVDMSGNQINYIDWVVQKHLSTDYIYMAVNRPATAIYFFVTIYVSGIKYLNPGDKELKIRIPDLQVGVPYEYYSEITLDSINQGVAGIGQQIGEIIGGGIKPIIPGGSGNLGADTDSIINNAQGGIDYAGGLLDNIGGALAQTATGFAALTAVFNLFSVMPFFSLLLQLSVTIGLFGLMTGLIGSIVSKFSVRGKGD